MLDAGSRSAWVEPADVVGGFFPRSDERCTRPKLWLRREATPRVAPDDPATCVVTDFARQDPVIVTGDRSIGDALREMVCRGVRALLVTREDVVTGLITSYDIQGPRPLQFLGCPSASYGELEVSRIMTPWEQVPALAWGAICAARVRHIDEYFRNTRATHVLVLERPEPGRHRGLFVRGLLSRTRLERELDYAS